MIVWVGLCTYADTVLKSCKNFVSLNFLLGCSLYASSAFLAVWSLRSQQFGWVTIGWNAMQLLCSIAIASATYHEPLTFRRLLASFLLLIAVVLAK